MATSDLDRALARARRDLRAGEVRSRIRLRAAYRTAIRALDRDLAALTARIAEANAAGEPVTRAWLLQERRSLALLSQAEATFDLFGRTVAEATRAGILDAIPLAQRHAEAAILAAMGPAPAGVSLGFAFPAGAFAEATAALSPGSPLSRLLVGFGQAGARAVETALLEGIARGSSPREVAEAIRRALGGQRARALTLARTEMLRAFRSASLATYRANARVVTAWVWSSALDARTCAACWSQHGRSYDLDTMMPAHPNCRCSLRPKTKTWAELGFDAPARFETSAAGPRGADLFARLSAADQRAILGPGAFAAYAAGEIELGDLAVTDRSPVWGPSVRRGSLANARRRAAARQRRAA